MLQQDEIIWQNEVLEMAKQTGLWFVTDREDLLMDFAKLVDAKAVRREREACVNAIKGRSQAKQDEWRVTRAMIVRECIEDIRARGQT